MMLAEKRRYAEELERRRTQERKRESGRRLIAAKAVGAFIRRLGAQQESEDWVLTIAELRRAATPDEVDAFVTAFLEREPAALERGRQLLKAAKARQAQGREPGPPAT